MAKKVTPFEPLTAEQQKAKGVTPEELYSLLCAEAGMPEEETPISVMD